MFCRSSESGCAEFQHADRMHRREFLRVGGLGALGLSLPALLHAEALASNSARDRPRVRAKSCIFVFLSGGPSQFETFDPKPEASSEIRNIFGTIPSKVPGTFLCEHLRDLAPLADRFALIRSAWHKYNGHLGGHRYALTGYPAPGPADQLARSDDRPGIASLAAKYQTQNGVLPLSVMIPWVTSDLSGISGGLGAGILGKQYDPLQVEVDVNTLDKSRVGKNDARTGKGPAFRVPAFALQPSVGLERFEGRKNLLGRIEAQRPGPLAGTAEMASFYQRAYDLLTSPKIKEGFDIDQEDSKVRARYGFNAFGQSCLMARRLVERGARFVQVNFSRYSTQAGYGWDTHEKGHDTLKGQLLPKLNAGLSSLLSELSERGLLDETLVVATGEFGRTPKLKKGGGRDHWPACYSLLLAGGEVHGGLVLGKSDKMGAHPTSDPVEARDILVTILTLLGMPTFVTDAQGRAAPVFEGAEPIARLYS